ncbi:hypothetical protein D3C87_151230 [compost metagenome]
MSTESSHIVHKLIVEVETNSKEKGYALKDDAAGFVSGSLSPALEELFEELEKKLNGKVLTLDRLSVDISAKTSDLTHGDIHRLISAAIEEEIKERISVVPESITENVQKTAHKHELRSEQGPDSHEQLISVTKRQLQSVFHFLKTGTRPWWLPDNASLSNLMKTSSLLELARTDLETLIQELQYNNSETFLKRMLLQLPESVLIEWFTRAFHFPAELPETIQKVTISIPNGELKKRWWTVLLNAFQEYRRKGSLSVDKIEQLIGLSAYRQESDPETIRAFVTSVTGQEISLSRERILQVIQENDEKQRSAPTQENDETAGKRDKTGTMELYTPVENAGLILLHPFLNPFLTEVGLLKDNQLSDPELTAHVLHFLATGNENAWEHELQFEKFLCGIPPDEPIQQERLISDEIKEEAGKLLAAVLEHWKTLKSDDPDLLRFEFLQREAKIIIEEYQGTRLVFERKAQDILLESLPWNLGIVKIDWRKDLLFVEW